MKTREERAREIVGGLRRHPDDPSLEKALRILDFSPNEFVSYIAQALPDLPSDREIRLAAREDAKGMRDDDSQSECYAGAVTGFEQGARWMREKMK